MIKRIRESIERFFEALAALQLPVHMMTLPKTDIFSVSKFLIVSLLFLIARFIVAGSANTFSQSIVLTGLAIGIFFFVGIVVRFVSSGAKSSAKQATTRVAGFIFMYWTLSIIFVVVVDVPLVVFTKRPLGAYLFIDLPEMLFGIQPTEYEVNLLRGLSTSLVAWAAVAYRSRVINHKFRIRSAFVTWEFPVFVTINTLLLVLFLFTPF